MFETSSKEVVIEPGFMVVVDSWENDADYPRTETKFFEKLEDAKSAIALAEHYSEIFGNDTGWNSEAYSTDGLTRDLIKWAIIQSQDGYIRDDIERVLALFEVDGSPVDEEDEETQDIIQTVSDVASDYAHEFMGGSETYTCRVMEAWNIFEIPEQVTFKSVVK